VLPSPSRHSRLDDRCDVMASRRQEIEDQGHPDAVTADAGLSEADFRVNRGPPHEVRDRSSSLVIAPESYSFGVGPAAMFRRERARLESVNRPSPGALPGGGAGCRGRRPRGRGRPEAASPARDHRSTVSSRVPSSEGCGAGSSPRGPSRIHGSFLFTGSPKRPCVRRHPPTVDPWPRVSDEVWSWRLSGDTV